MDSDHSPFGVTNVVDHGLDNFRVHLEIPVGQSLTLGPDHIARAAGIADADLAHITGVTFDNATTTSPSAAGIVVSHGPATVAAIGNRTLSLKSGSSKVESVHAVVSPHIPFSPTSLQFHTATLPTHEVVKTAVARVARWKDADVSNLDHDVESVSQNGATRYLVPSTVDHGSSAISTLFNRNAANPGFLNNKYSTANRQMVNDKIVVTSADMTQAVTSLKDNLTTKSNIANGLTFRATTLHDGATPSGIVHAIATIHRVPLHADHFDAENIATSKCMTVHSALSCMGETSAPEAMPLSSTSEVSAAFAVNLDE
jgi:hypothetical protein